MRIKNEAVRKRRWAGIEKSHDPTLGTAVLTMAEAWANALEPLLDSGLAISEVAIRTHSQVMSGHEALDFHSPLCDVMVEYLEDCWQFGSILAKWYRTQR